MFANMTPVRRGGDHHALIICSVLAILLSLAIFLPGAGQAADVPAEHLIIGALPPPFRPTLSALRPYRISRDTGTTYDIRAQEDPGQDDTETAIVLSQDEYRRLKTGASLTPEEYQEFKRLTTITRATPMQVALVNIAIKGTGLLVVGLAWVALLLILRRVFNLWFDADVHKNTWASAVVILMLLLCTAWILVSVVA